MLQFYICNSLDLISSLILSIKITSIY